MSDVKVPSLGESVTEALLTRWLKAEGDRVEIDEPICELESDKATVDLPAPASGVLRPKKAAGQSVRIGESIADIDDQAQGQAAPPIEAKAPAVQSSAQALPVEQSPAQALPVEQSPAQALPVERSAAEALAPQAEANVRSQQSEEVAAPAAVATSPAAPERPPPLRPTVRPPTQRESSAAEAPRPRTAPAATDGSQPRPARLPASGDGTRREPMSKIRRSIAERLVRSQQTAAMLTTFNEIDMTAVQELRRQHGEKFKEVHGVGLGFMSFFARASALALKHFPVLNAMIDEDSIVYHDHVHVGVAVSTERGLVVPVLRNVEGMSFARSESEIKRAAGAAREGKLSLQDLSGGTFTITNGGVFGSLLSTPILYPPQTGILGMHVLQERPVALAGQVVIRPMMYVALTYDHRLVDGQQAVSFLVHVKGLLENPMRMILDI
jgi:2-oxoglutarate dehydrogenase E2 component (dihydrolipoamide succinyltransferase)